jgi:hypothetical protein
MYILILDSMTNKKVMTDVVFPCFDHVQPLPAAITKKKTITSKSERLMMFQNGTLSINH